MNWKLNLQKSKGLNAGGQFENFFHFLYRFFRAKKLRASRFNELYVTLEELYTDENGGLKFTDNISNLERKFENWTEVLSGVLEIAYKSEPRFWTTERYRGQEIYPSRAEWHSYKNSRLIDELSQVISEIYHEVVDLMHRLSRKSNEFYDEENNFTEEIQLSSQLRVKFVAVVRKIKQEFPQLIPFLDKKTHPLWMEFQHSIKRTSLKQGNPDWGHYSITPTMQKKADQLKEILEKEGNYQEGDEKLYLIYIMGHPKIRQKELDEGYGYRPYYNETSRRLRRYAIHINKMLRDIERNPDRFNEDDLALERQAIARLIQEFRDTEILQEILSDDPQLTLNNLRGN